MCWVRFTGVALSVVAWYSISSSFASVSTYETRTCSRARIALFAIRADARERDAAHAGDRLGSPDVLVEPADAAVQVIRTVVRRELIGPAVQ